MRGVWVLGPSGIAQKDVQDPQGNMRPDIMEKVEARCSGSTRKEYTLKLLDPEKPDDTTEKAFKVLKDFVENLQYNAFNPLYTTDYRCFLGRYYRVTVNKYSSPPIYGASATRTVVTRRRR